MNYWLFIVCIIFASFIICGILALKDTSSKCKKGAHLKKLDNTDISCGKAFESLELFNAWGDE